MTVENFRKYCEYLKKNRGIKDFKGRLPNEEAITEIKKNFKNNPDPEREAIFKEIVEGIEKPKKSK